VALLQILGDGLSKDGSVPNARTITVPGMAGDPFDPQAMVARFRERAKAVRGRGVPPLEGEDRKRYIEQAQLDYMDFAMLADAEATLDDGVLTLKVNLKKS
jgi:hypothetical protein